jgi:hypothetical protein
VSTASVPRSPPGAKLSGEQFRLRSSLPSVDAEGFFEAVSEALQLYIVAETPPDGVVPIYIHEFPKERLTKPDQAFDVVTFRVVSSVPASVLNDGTVSRKPVVSFWTLDPENTGYALRADVYMELLTVEFQVWSKSNPTRSKLVNWFHRFLLRQANRTRYFEARGADKFQFVGRGEDGFETREEQEIYYGTLTYQVRTQFVDTYSERLLDQITVASQFGPDQQTILQTA